MRISRTILAYPTFLFAIMFVILAIVIWSDFKIRQKIDSNQILIQNLEKQHRQLTENTLGLIDEATKWTEFDSLESTELDIDNKLVVWRYTTFYKSPNGLFTKGEHVIFGELVMRAFGFRNFNDELKGHWVTVEKGGVWHMVEAEKSPQINLIRNDVGKVTGAEIILRDKNGNEVVRRKVERKNQTKVISTLDLR